MHTSYNKKIMVCTNYRSNPNNPSCGARGSDEVLAALSDMNLAITVEGSPCMGLCDVGPNIRFAPNGACFHEVSTKNINCLIKAIKSFMKC